MGSPEELRKLESLLAAVEKGEATPEMAKELEDAMDARHGAAKART